MQEIPFFKYHPDPIKTEAFKVSKKHKKCECCGEMTNVFYENMYCIADIKCICPKCIKNGEAAKKFEGVFVQDADEISDEQKKKELFERTPGYISWQGEHWLACCDDYCEFLGDVGTKELEQMGIADDVIARYEARGEYQDVREYLEAKGSLCGYLFRCLHCKSYHLQVDAD